MVQIENTAKTSRLSVTLRTLACKVWPQAADVRLHNIRDVSEGLDVVFLEVAGNGEYEYATVAREWNPFASRQDAVALVAWIKTQPESLRFTTALFEILRVSRNSQPDDLCWALLLAKGEDITRAVCIACDIDLGDKPFS